MFLVHRPGFVPASHLQHVVFSWKMFQCLIKISSFGVTKAAALLLLLMKKSAQRHLNLNISQTLKAVDMNRARKLSTNKHKHQLFLPRQLLLITAKWAAPVEWWNHAKSLASTSMCSLRHLISSKSVFFLVTDWNRSKQLGVFAPLNVCLAVMEDGIQPDMAVMHISLWQ